MNYNHFKRQMLAFVAVLAIFVLGSATNAQISVSGIVKDAKTGEAIIGASILEKGTNNGVITNMDGAFIISVASTSTLIVRYLGYLAQEIPVSGKTNLMIQLNEDAVALGEVISIGYGVQKKSDKTGAVMNVSSSEFNKGVLTDPIQALQGKASGVQITKKGGNPNDGFSVQIRGAGGLATGSSPLYVIDGVPGVDPTTIPTEDIESFNILKDASSTAIYGSRGANGIIIITTKRGQSVGGKSSISVNGYVSVDQVSKRLDLLSATDIRSFIKRNNIPQVDPGASTDWQSEIYRKGLTQNYNVAIGGGNENSNYRVSGTWSDFQGVVRGTDKQRFITTASVLQKLLNNKLVIDGNLAATFEENQYQDFGGNSPTDVMYQAFQRTPLQPVTKQDGSYYENAGYGFQYFNPLAIINDIQNQRSAKRLRTNGSIQYEILPGLKAKVNGAYTRDDSESFYFVPLSSPTSSTNGSGSRSYANTTTKLLEAFINYDKTFSEKHTLAIVGGYSWQGQLNDGFNAFGTNAQSAYVESNNLAGLADVNYGSIGSYKNDWTLISFFGRAAYDYDKKYFATVTVRRDGSSKFGANNKWGTFPSGSLAWSAKNEPFLQNVSWLDQLKLRVGYGLTGNTEGFASYWSLPVIYPTGMQPSMDDGVSHTVVYQTSRDANPDLKWETMQEVNIGLDWAVLNSRVQGSIELYSRRTVDLIYQYSLPQPPSKTGNVEANAGIMTNKGIEANISYQVIDMKNLNYRTSLTFSHNINNIEKLSSGNYNWKDKQRSYIQARGMVGQWTQYIDEGLSLGTWYLPHFVSFLDGKFEYATAAGGITPDIKDAERRNAGSATPKVNLGWSNTFTLYKNIDLSFSLRAVLGYKVYNVSAMYFSNPTLLPTFNANQQAVTWYENKTDGTPIASDYWLEDGSFVRLDNLTIGYNVPNTKGAGIEKLRIYFTGNNLLTITGYKGIDPELSYSGLEYGLDNFNVYPKTSSFTLGVQLIF